MGCFTSQKPKKKPAERSASISLNIQENGPTPLPKPESPLPETSSRSAPPSFRSKVRTIQHVNRFINHRPGSSPLSEKEAQPLPLPPVLNDQHGSFKSGSLPVSGGALPLPLPRGSLRCFTYEEMVDSYRKISPEGAFPAVFSGRFRDLGSQQILEASVVRLPPSSQMFKEFHDEVNKIASLQHPHLCKLIGYFVSEGSGERMLVYESLTHGSLDRFLYGRSDGLLIDWGTRIRIALTAAQGLLFLHEAPFQALYKEFKTSCIQIDKDFSAKLWGYGCANFPTETGSGGTSSLVSENVWNMGVVLLELLTGRQNSGPKEERDLVKWSRPFLLDESMLSMIVDPRLKGRFPLKAAKAVAETALKCLQQDPSERPHMRAVVKSLRSVQGLKHTCKFPLQEPAEEVFEIAQLGLAIYSFWKQQNLTA